MRVYWSCLCIGSDSMQKATKHLSGRGLHPDLDQNATFSLFGLPLHLGCLNMDGSLSAAVNWNTRLELVILLGEGLHVRIAAHVHYAERNPGRIIKKKVIYIYIHVFTRAQDTHTYTQLCFACIYIFANVNVPEKKTWRSNNVPSNGNLNTYNSG